MVQTWKQKNKLQHFMDLQRNNNKKQTKEKTMKNEYTKNLTIKNTETNTKWMLYYMGKATDAIRKGESPVRWLCAAVEYGADLKTNYAQAENLEIWENLDFVEIYKKALEQAKQEIEND